MNARDTIRFYVLFPIARAAVHGLNAVANMCDDAADYLFDYLDGHVVTRYRPPSAAHPATPCPPWEVVDLSTVTYPPGISPLEFIEDFPPRTLNGHH